jgi:uncharacterized protein
MPTAPTYPGVYIEEVSSGVRTITGVATSITAFIGRAERGPTDKAMTINSYSDFERTFGGLWTESRLGFAVRDFYLNGGAQAIIVRLFHPTFADEADRLAALNTATTQAQTAADAVATAATTAAAIATPVATVQSVMVAVNGAVAAVEAAAGVSASAIFAAKAVAKAAAGAAATPAPTPTAVATAATGAVAAAVLAAANNAAPITLARLSVNTLELQAASAGKWGNALRARIDHDVKGPDATNLFNLSIRDDTTEILEVFRNVSVVAGHPRQVDKVLENESALVRVVGALPPARPGFHVGPQPGKSIWDDSTPATNTKVSVPASDGKHLEKADFTGTGKAAAKRGLYALEQADLFNLLCIPPHLSTDNMDYTLIADLLEYCGKRRAMLLIDPPTSWTDKDLAKSGIEAGVGDSSKNAAVFFPRLRQPNPLLDNQFDNFVPCGAIAGVISRTDSQRGVWKAPAGLDATLIGVPQLSVSLTDPENGELNQLGINCLRVKPAAGRIVWGSRTRVGDDRLASEWKYLPVRRTALFLEESLYRGMQWAVFEPNDEPLWAQIRLNVGAFMHNLFRQGAFQGKTPREAYLVKCDRETTTQNDINLGIVNVVVGFAPLKPAEFVIIKLQQLAGQIEV